VTAEFPSMLEVSDTNKTASTNTSDPCRDNKPQFLDHMGKEMVFIFTVLEVGGANQYSISSSINLAWLAHFACYEVQRRSPCTQVKSTS